jgi:hypothetical protein
MTVTTPQAFVCDHCKNKENPVTEANGGFMSTTAGGQKIVLAYVHNSCKTAWAQARSGATYEALGN